MEQKTQWRWISILCFDCPAALKFGDEDIQFLFRQVAQIALGQIGTAVLKFGIFGVRLCHKLLHFRSRLGRAQLPGGRLAAITGRRPLSNKAYGLNSNEHRGVK
jgi:hypothetical protein